MSVDLVKDAELLENGLEKLNEALNFIMEMESEKGTMLSNILHFLVTQGEQLLSSYK